MAEIPHAPPQKNTLTSASEDAKQLELSLIVVGTATLEKFIIFL